MVGRSSSGPAALHLTLLGVGAMRSPRFAPAGLLLRLRPGGGMAEVRVAFDGGGRAGPGSRLDAWLVTDDRAELIGEIRRQARPTGVVARVAPFRRDDLRIAPKRVTHTSHPTWAYEIRWRGRRIIWAPEFWRIPRFAAGSDIVFADAAGWARPIRFRGGVGGHASALDVADAARRIGVRRLVFAHIGRPTIRAIDAGARPPFGEFGRDGQRIRIAPAGDPRRRPRA